MMLINTRCVCVNKVECLFIFSCLLTRKNIPIFGIHYFIHGHYEPNLKVPTKLEKTPCKYGTETKNNFRRHSTPLVNVLINHLEI